MLGCACPRGAMCGQGKGYMPPAVPGHPGEPQAPDRAGEQQHAPNPGLCGFQPPFSNILTHANRMQGAPNPAPGGRSAAGTGSPQQGWHGGSKHHQRSPAEPDWL